MAEIELPGNGAQERPLALDRLVVVRAVGRPEPPLRHQRLHQGAFRWRDEGREGVRQRFVVGHRFRDRVFLLLLGGAWAIREWKAVLRTMVADLERTREERALCPSPRSMAAVKVAAVESSGR